jgi:hypothetical protein
MVSRQPRIAWATAGAALMILVAILVTKLFLAARSGTVLAAVYDVRTGQLWTLGRGKAQPEASIVKVDILETLVAQHRADGQPLSAQDRSLARAMIEDSDNDAATALWDAVGGARGIAAFDSALGLAHTRP